MKKFIVGLFVLISTAYITIIAKEDPGYALISHGDWSVEMTLVLLVFAFVAVILSLLVVIYLFYKLLFKLKFKTIVEMVSLLFAVTTTN